MRKYLCDHDVHHFVNGVTLVRVDPDRKEGDILQWWHYDRGHGVIVVGRGTGYLRGVGAGVGEQFEALRRSIEGLL